MDKPAEKAFLKGFVWDPPHTAAGGSQGLLPWYLSKTSCDVDTYSIKNLQLDLIQILSPGLMESVHKGGVWEGKVNWRQMQTL